MKKIVKKFGKCLIIYVTLIMLLLSNTCYAGYTQEQVGTAIAETAVYIANNYASNIEYSQPKRTSNPIWGGSSYSWTSGTNYFDCSSFASGVGYMVAGMFGSAQSTGSLMGYSSGGDYEKGLVTSMSDLQVGDIVFWNGSGNGGHAVIYVGSTSGAGGTACEVGGASGNIGFRSMESYINNHTFYYIRVSESYAESLTTLNTEFSSGVTQTTSSSSGIDFSNFYFNGIPDGEYSVTNRTSIFSVIVETLETVANYLIGSLTYIFRMVIVGLTGVIYSLFNWTVNTVSNTGTEEIDIGSVELTSTDSDTRVTIESIFYGTLELLDINIFKTTDE